MQTEAQSLTEAVLERLRQIAFAETDEACKPQEQLRAMELLMKHLNMLDRQSPEEAGVTVELAPPLSTWAE